MYFKNFWSYSGTKNIYCICVVAVSILENEQVQMGFFMHWAEIIEILGRFENFQTGTFSIPQIFWGNYTITVKINFKTFKNSEIHYWESEFWK